MVNTGQGINPLVKYIIPGLLGILFMLGLTGAIYLVTSDNTLGTDFFIYYAAGQNITKHHLSPYDESVGARSQMAILKHPAGENEDQLRFVYPPYALLLVLPLTGLPFPWAQAVWMTFNLTSISVAIMYGFRKISSFFMVTLFFLFPLAFGLMLGNLNMAVIAILVLLAGRLPHLGKLHPVESCFLGLLLAWATVKPQFSAFFILFFLLFGIKNQNRTFLLGFFSGFAGLLAFSFLLIPDWISQWIALLRRYPTYIGGRIPISPLIEQVFPLNEAVLYAALVCLIALLVVWFIFLWWNSKISSLSFLAIGGLVTYFFTPTGLSYDQMTFLLPFLVWTIQGWKQKPLIVISCWCITVIGSWIFLYLSMDGIWPGATYYGQYFLYILWMLTVYRMYPGNMPEVTLSPGH